MQSGITAVRALLTLLKKQQKTGKHVMNRRTLFGMACMMMMMLLVMGAVSAAAAEKAEPEDQLTGAGEKLLSQYTEMLTTLQAEIAKAMPEIDAKKRDAFLKAHAAVGGAQPYQDTNPAFVQAQANALRAAKPLLAEVEAFLASDKLEARLVKCAVLANATPRGLAEFAQQGEKEAKLVDQLLADDDLMKQMLTAGGAANTAWQYRSIPISRRPANTPARASSSASRSARAWSRPCRWSAMAAKSTR